MRAAFLFIFVLYWTNALSQVVFNQLPRTGSVIPRNLKTNRAETHCSGKITGSYTKVRLQCTQNGKSFSDQTKLLNFAGGVSNFDMVLFLPAGKYRYNLTLNFIGTDTLTYLIKDILVGDVYIIQGQSNAVANSYSGLANPTYKDSFIRTFGTTYFDAVTTEKDTQWYIANGDGYYASGCIGQWGLIMGKTLLDSFGIPIAIINGAVGGTSVTYHQRYNPQPNNTSTCYGRLLYRMEKANLTKNVRGIFWFQGESDGPYPKLHDSLFRQLYKDWSKDFKGMEKNYLVQVRGGGCGSPAAEILEVQRQFEFTLSKLKVISSNGLNGHDGCHYYLKDGYKSLGLQLAALVSRDLYQSGRINNIDPPGIASVTWNNGAKTELELEMLQPNDSIFADPNFHALFHINGDNSVQIIGGSVFKNRIILQLSGTTCNPISLTYLGKPGAQPWVKNRIGAGLVSFHQIPVNNKTAKKTYYGCIGTVATIGEDSIKGCNYSWFNLQSKKRYSTSKILHH
ncbi:MAG: hypothetical protein IT244_06985, partial [Bacteroidia bacterium]|nr:hypothetical protein [Bacteroidia bacterium]